GDLVGVPVLVVDDNRTNRRVLCESLARWGMRPVAVESAAAALAFLESNALPLVVTDVPMPEMGGFERVESIQRRDGPPTIMMLASGNHVDDVARCRRLGAAAYLTKPVALAELRPAVLEALGSRRASERETPAAIQEPLPSVRHFAEALSILLAE